MNADGSTYAAGLHVKTTEGTIFVENNAGLLDVPTGRSAYVPAVDVMPAYTVFSPRFSEVSNRDATAGQSDAEVAVAVTAEQEDLFIERWAVLNSELAETDTLTKATALESGFEEGTAGDSDNGQRNTRFASGQVRSEQVAAAAVASVTNNAVGNGNGNNAGGNGNGNAFGLGNGNNAGGNGNGAAVGLGNGNNAGGNGNGNAFGLGNGNNAGGNGNGAAVGLGNGNNAGGNGNGNAFGLGNGNNAGGNGNGNAFLGAAGGPGNGNGV